MVDGERSSWPNKHHGRGKRNERNDKPLPVESQSGIYRVVQKWPSALLELAARAHSRAQPLGTALH